MRERRKWKRLRAYQWLAGVCDSLTGVMLIAMPEGTLRLMGVRTPPVSEELVSLSGAFVLGVGLAYLTVTRVPLTVSPLELLRNPFLPMPYDNLGIPAATARSRRSASTGRSASAIRRPTRTRPS